MNKVKQEEMLNRHIDHISSKKAEKQMIKYYLNIGGNEIAFKISKN